MLTVTNLKNQIEMQFENSTQLKEFLKFQNPTFLKHYINKISELSPDLSIIGCGEEITIKRVKC